MSAQQNLPDFSDALKGDIWDLLVREVEANPNMRTEFMAHWPKCREFRFQGRLAFGGKIWHQQYGNGHRVYVTCYSEDENPERDHLIQRMNRLLGNLLHSHGVLVSV